MTLDEAVSEIEKEFVCADGPACSTDALGREYVCLCSGGFHVEQELIAAVFFTPEAAVADWLMRMRNHARVVGAKKGARLFWRIRPEIDESAVKLPWWYNGPDEPPTWVETSVWRIYSRFSLDTPALEVA